MGGGELGKGGGFGDALGLLGAEMVDGRGGEPDDRAGARQGGEGRDPPPTQPGLTPTRKRFGTDVQVAGEGVGGLGVVVGGGQGQRFAQPIDEGAQVGQEGLADEQGVVAVVAAEAGEAERDEFEGVGGVGVELIVEGFCVAEQRGAVGRVEGEPRRGDVGERLAAVGGGGACDGWLQTLVPG